MNQPLPTPIDWTAARVIVTGGAGFLGSHVVATLADRGVGADRLFIPRSKDFDLTTPSGAGGLCREAFTDARPDVIIHCAGYVGGLGANLAYPARFASDNLLMTLNLLDAAVRAGLAAHGTRITLVGSMTAYPESAPSPCREDDIFTGLPDPAVRAHGLAKRMMLSLLQAYHAQHGLLGGYVIPMNLFGPGDTFDPAMSHAAAAVIGRCLRAHLDSEPRIVSWGTGSPVRQFLYVADAAEGVVRAAERIVEPIPVNLAPAQETSIKELVETACGVIGYRGEIAWDPARPDGSPRRSLDATRASALLGWSPKVSLEEGIRRTVEWRLGQLGVSHRS